jgi:7-carboxy-7-deazaguanine synthase
MTTYPISECFDSIQGEGYWAGQRQFFIRLAGCSVGKPFPKERYSVSQEGSKALPIYTEKCTTWDGRSFECDTDYRVKQHSSVKELTELVPGDCYNVCLTGGEPFIHNLTPLVYELYVNNGIKVHIETSGTRDIDDAFEGVDSYVRNDVWVTVSPKFGCLDSMIKRADEIKLLVDIDFPAKNDLLKKLASKKNVYLQPINHEHSIDSHNIKVCQDFLKQYPDWKLSIQLHKVMGIR